MNMVSQLWMYIHGVWVHIAGEEAEEEGLFLILSNSTKIHYTCYTCYTIQWISAVEVQCKITVDERTKGYNPLNITCCIPNKQHYSSMLIVSCREPTKNTWMKKNHSRGEVYVESSDFHLWPEAVMCSVIQLNITHVLKMCQWPEIKLLLLLLLLLLQIEITWRIKHWCRD